MPIDDSVSIDIKKDQRLMIVFKVFVIPIIIIQLLEVCLLRIMHVYYICCELKCNPLMAQYGRERGGSSMIYVVREIYTSNLLASSVLFYIVLHVMRVCNMNEIWQWDTLMW